jgi:hypothetical protein
VASSFFVFATIIPLFNLLDAIALVALRFIRKGAEKCGIILVIFLGISEETASPFAGLAVLFFDREIIYLGEIAWI